MQVMHSSTRSQNSTCVPESRHTRPLFDHELLVAESFEHVEVGCLAIEDTFDLTFAGDVLDLSAAERIVFHNLLVVYDVRDLGNHGLPDVKSGFGVRTAEHDLEEEPALKGGVEVVGQVGGGNEDAIELFHLL